MICARHKVFYRDCHSFRCLIRSSSDPLITQNPLFTNTPFLDSLGGEVNTCFCRAAYGTILSILFCPFFGRFGPITHLDLLPLFMSTVMECLFISFGPIVLILVICIVCIAFRGFTMLQFSRGSLQLSLDCSCPHLAEQPGHGGEFIRSACRGNKLG